MIASASICSGQTVSIIEKLPDGSFIVAIDSVEYRAISGDRAVELAKQKISLQECRENEARYIQLNEIATRDVKIAQQQKDIEHTNFVHAMSLYEKERELRTEAMKFLPRKTGGFGGKVLSFLDSPVGQIGFRLVLPAAQFFKVMK